jgi:hypothetical protein
MFNSNFLTLDDRIRDGFREGCQQDVRESLEVGKLQNFIVVRGTHCRFRICELALKRV